EQLEQQNWSKAKRQTAHQKLTQSGIPPAKTLASRLLTITYAQQSILEELAQLFAIDFNQFLQTRQPYLQSSQIRTMINDGFHFGAHSIDHPHYAALAFEEQIRQTQESLDWLSTTFQVPHRTFAFPFTDDGVSTAFFQQLANTQMAELTFACAGLKQAQFPFHFQRIPLEAYPSSAAQQMRGEYWYYLLKAVLGKNKIHRNNSPAK
ncbi:MAG: polysaccharide deacetylase family protein, partial [Bacteroidota bacterium]